MRIPATMIAIVLFRQGKHRVKLASVGIDVVT